MDTNLPPETWITAAPQDTLTTRDENGGLVPPVPGTIPFRYHLYWSGSDQDGAVAGFYWAVVETVGSGGGPPAPLPGPRARDYHYISVTDSVFIFNVFQETNNREHAFYIYAVDNKGKPDATPARLIFNTLDLYPPVPVIEAECGVKNPTSGSRATGRIFHHYEAWDGVGVGPVTAPIETTIALCDTFSRRSTVSDIIPMGATVDLRWHSEISVANNPATGYRYKIGEGNEVEFVQVPASVTGTQYTPDRNPLSPGLKIFTLRAIDQANGARTSPETTRRFYMNMSPDTWFSGPDSVPASNPTFYTVVRYKNGQLKERYFQAGLGSNPTGWKTPIPGSLLNSVDSTNIMVAKRKANKTFFEIYTEYNFDNTNQPRHRIYVHSEGDTVHMNSWVLFHGGGFDADSPYSLRILIDNHNLPGIGTTPVLTSGGANGSPVGHRFRIPVLLDSIGPLRSPGSGTITTFPQSQVYPSSDPAFVPEPHIGGYQGMQQSGKAYAILRSEDGNRGLDNRIVDPVAFADSIEQGLIGPGSPRYALKDKVITFYVNRAPYLLVDDSSFEPRPGQDFSPLRTIKLTLNKSADDDPYQTLQRSVGGMEEGKSSKLIRFSVTLRGKAVGSGRDTVYAPPELARKSGTSLTIATGYLQEVPPFIRGPEVGVDIEVCDCRDCETVPGQGRCRRYPTINVLVKALPEPVTSPSRATVSPIGPGSSGESSRSRTP